MVGQRPHPPLEQQSSGEGSHDGPRNPPATFPPLEKIPETPGINKLCGTIHRVWAPSPQADHPDLPKLQGQEIPATIAAVPTTPPMVDPDTEPGSPSSHVHPTSQPHGLDKTPRKQGGGGGIFSGIHGQRRLVPRREPPPHKHPGMTRSLLLLKPPQGSVLLVRTDNTVVVSLINKQGSNKSKILSRFLHELLTLCARTNRQSDQGTYQATSTHGQTPSLGVTQ